MTSENKVALAGIAGMIALGLSAATVYIIRLDLAPAQLAYMLATVVSGTLGLLILIFLIPCLTPTDLSKSLPFVFGISWPFTVAWSLLEPFETPLSSAAVAVVCVCISGLFARKRYPRLTPSQCPLCHYDLAQCRESGCPECGWNRDPHAAIQTNSDEHR